MSQALHAVQAAHPGQHVCLWSQEESRFGLHTVPRRRLTLPAIKPVCPFEQSFENFWRCGAVQPNTGDSFVLELPATDSDCLQGFLDPFALAHARAPDGIQVLLRDNGGAHRAKALRWPERVVPVYRPAYCPELNPIRTLVVGTQRRCLQPTLWQLGRFVRLPGQGTGHLEPGTRTPLLTNKLRLLHRRSCHAGSILRNGVSSLLTVAGEHKAAYLTTLFTGLRRNEPKALERSDVFLDASQPYLSAQPSTTKNRRQANVCLHEQVIVELRAIKPASLDGRKVFAGPCLPGMWAFRTELQRAGTTYVDAQGCKADFHALRYTFATNLPKAGVLPREATELLRHSDMRLTMKTYTDAGLLLHGRQSPACPSSPSRRSAKFL